MTNGEKDPATGLPFLDSEGLFFVETVPISETRFKNMPGYPLEHRRLSHCPMLTIRDTIPHERELRNYQRNPLTKMSTVLHQCMIGKAHLEVRPRSREHAKLPLERVYMDIMSSSIPSMEGYNYALVIVDDASMNLWVYGLKEKSEANATAQQWICEHSKHQSATCTADIDSRQCWRAKKCRSQRIHRVIGC